MSRGLSAVLVLLAIFALAACDDTAKPTTAPTSPAPTAVATTPAGEAMQQLAGAGLKASYHATYTAHRAKPSGRATWNVARTPNALRIDVTDRGVTATFIVSGHGAFACTRAKHRKTCFRVARAGHKVPDLFSRLAPRPLFDASLRALSAHAGLYAVKRAGTTTGPGDVRGTCFAIRARSTAPTPHVATGTYCFADSGVLTSVRFPTGSSARLTSLSLRTPKQRAFRPYASPTPLPG